MNGLITGLYAAPIGLLVVGLGLRVVQLRVRYRVGIGDGGHGELARAIRAHGNLIEYAPLALVLLLLTELSHALPGPALHAAGGAIVVGRLLHAAGLSRTAAPSGARLAGMLLTWGATLALALSLLARAWPA